MIQLRSKWTLSKKTRLTSTGSQIKAFYLVSILVMVIAFTLVLINIWQSVKRDFEQELKHTNQLFQQTIKATFAHHESMLRVIGRRLMEISTGPDQNPELGRRLIDDLLELNSSMAGFGLARADGQLILVSGILDGRKLPNLLVQPESSDGFKKALNSDRMVIGRTYYMPLLSRWLVPIRLSLRDANNEVQFVMVAGIDIDSPATLWNAIKPGKEMHLTLMRNSGFVQLLIPSPKSERKKTFSQKHQSLSLLANGKVKDPLTNSTLAVSTRLQEYGLSTYSSYPRTRFTSELGNAMLWPTLFLLVAFIGSWALYRYVLRHQESYEKHLIHQAHHDALTQLPNRFLLCDRLGQDIERARRTKAIVAIIYLDLDQFKRVNDSYGHGMGDHLLKACALRLQRLLREGDTFGRQGGDEFLLIFPDLKSANDAQRLATRVMDEFSEPFDCAGRMLFSTASLGISLFPADGDNTELLLQNADTALYKAKDNGRNSCCFFQPSLNQATARRIAVETELRQALFRNELTLHYQPKSSLDSDIWVGAEALLRWYNPTLGQISPVEFIPIAEETGLIEDIGWFVLEQALKTLDAAIKYSPDFNMSINVSVRQLHSRTFKTQLLDMISKTGINIELIELEVTESILVDDQKQLESLSDAGLHLAVDDFGTGFSSLSYLKHLPVTTLKIDREFIVDLETDSTNAAMTAAIITLARELKLTTIAEGVETKEQREILRQQKCTLMQGYLLSKPIPEKEFLHHLSTQS